jgi:hypothetical protein
MGDLSRLKIGRNWSKIDSAGCSLFCPILAKLA